jgi:flagellar biosynthesis/type III secretory pathway ATPase
MGKIEMIGIGSKVKIKETASLKFCHGLIGRVVDKYGDITKDLEVVTVKFNTDDFPTTNKSIKRDKAERSFWIHHVENIPDNRLLDWLRK